MSEGYENKLTLAGFLKQDPRVDLTGKEFDLIISVHEKELAALRAELAAVQKASDNNLVAWESACEALREATERAEAMREALLESRAALYGCREIVGDIANVSHAINLSNAALDAAKGV